MKVGGTRPCRLPCRGAVAGRCIPSPGRTPRTPGRTRAGTRHAGPHLSSTPRNDPSDQVGSVPLRAQPRGMSGRTLGSHTFPGSPVHLLGSLRPRRGLPWHPAATAIRPDGVGSHRLSLLVSMLCGIAACLLRPCRSWIGATRWPLVGNPRTPAREPSSVSSRTGMGVAARQPPSRPSTTSVTTGTTRSATTMRNRGATTRAHGGRMAFTRTATFRIPSSSTLKRCPGARTRSTTTPMKRMRS